jgi:hypothetical protein
MAMKRNRVRLTDDERRKFDDVGLDDINAMTDPATLQKLMQYMECVRLRVLPRDPSIDRSAVRRSLPSRRLADHPSLPPSLPPFSAAERKGSRRPRAW